MAHSSLLDILSSILYKHREIKEMVAQPKIRPLHREQDRDQAAGEIDPVLAMLGVGQHGSLERGLVLAHVPAHRCDLALRLGYLLVCLCCPCCVHYCACCAH